MHLLCLQCVSAYSHTISTDLYTDIHDRPLLNCTRLDPTPADYKKVLEIEPASHAAKEKVRALPEEIRIQQEKMKDEMLGMWAV